MLRNKNWLATIDELLWGGDGERHRALDIIWLAVFNYVIFKAKLPIGPLADNEENRRNIALQVMEKLLRDDYKHTREWRRRQAQGSDCASWMGFVARVTTTKAIDYARTSKLRMSARGEHFVFADEKPSVPVALEETTSSTAAFLAHCEYPARFEFLERLNSVRARTKERAPPRETPRQPPPAPAPQPLVRRRRPPR
jgi:hypothetical protein